MKRFPKMHAWVDQTEKPTLKQLEAFARYTYTPIGYFFLAEPPVERVPIPDMRTIGNEFLGAPSPHLLDTVHMCEHRQAWYREFARTMGQPPLDFVGSVLAGRDVVATAIEMRRALAMDMEERRHARTWSDALRLFVAQAERLGVLVMINGIVGTNTHRKLDPREFRGFALADKYAPLVFVNGADTKSAQMFTLAHELAHIWTGESAVTDDGLLEGAHHALEQWCNQVAAEILVPLATLAEELAINEGEPNVADLCRTFKVSSLVIIRRLYDVGAWDRDTMWATYQAELARLKALKTRARGGGNFYLSQANRVSRRFARAVFTSTWEGRSSFTEAFSLLSISNIKTFRKFGDAVGASV